MNLIELNNDEVLLYSDDIMKKTELSYEELQELVKTKDGIKQLIQLLTKKMEENSEELYYPFKGMLILIRHLDNDEITNTYLYHNDFIYNEIINNKYEYYDIIVSIISNIESDEIKAAVFNKYKEIFVYEEPENGKEPYDTKSLIKTIFSFHSHVFIEKIFSDETISTILKNTKFEDKIKVIKRITKKKTDKEKRECIIPEVLLYLDPCHRNKPIVSIESDSIKKDCMNDNRIKEILLNDKRHHTYAKVIASYKESENIETALEEGINDNLFDGEDLAIMIRSIKGDAKKTEYRNDKRIEGKLSFDEEAVIIASYNEEGADQVKFNYIISRIIDEAKRIRLLGLDNDYLIYRYHQALKNILCSMNFSMKKNCLNDEQIKSLLYFSDICEIVKSYEDDNEKLTFIKENADRLASNTYEEFKELVLTMKAKYKKQCLEDANIVAILNANKEKDNGGLTVINIVASNIKYYENKKKRKKKKYSDEEIKIEQEEEDTFKNDFLRKEIQNLEDREIYSIINSINDPELKLNWVIECAEKNIINLNYIDNITKDIDNDKYKIIYDDHHIKPVSYKRR